MKISSNILALTTVNNLNKANNSAGKAMERLSSGLKINSASDNPAGYALSTKLNTQTKGLNQANQNTMDAISLIQTAEGAMNEIHSILNKLRELTVQGANGTLSDDDKLSVQNEIDALIGEVNSITEATEYNTMGLLTTTEDIIIQTGANSSQAIVIKQKDINVGETLEILKDLNLDDVDAITKVDQAIQKTSELRGKMGAYQNNFEHIVNNLGENKDNLTESLSRIQDADMAEEMANYTQYNVIAQAGIAMLSQANQRPQQVLQLLNS